MPAAWRKPPARRDLYTALHKSRAKFDADGSAQRLVREPGQFAFIFQCTRY